MRTSGFLSKPLQRFYTFFGIIARNYFPLLGWTRPPQLGKGMKVLSSIMSFTTLQYHTWYPASIISLSAWVAATIIKSNSQINKSYPQDLRSYYIDMGCDIAAFTHPRLERIVHGGKRYYDEAERRKRFPIARENLIFILQQIPYDRNGINLKAVLCLGSQHSSKRGIYLWQVGRFLTIIRIYQSSATLNVDRSHSHPPHVQNGRPSKIRQHTCRRRIEFPNLSNHDSSKALQSLSNSLYGPCFLQGLIFPITTWPDPSFFRNPCILRHSYRPPTTLATSRTSRIKSSHLSAPIDSPHDDLGCLESAGSPRQQLKGTRSLGVTMGYKTVSKIHPENKKTLKTMAGNGKGKFRKRMRWKKWVL
jgi:hypothetical protein